MDIEDLQEQIKILGHKINSLERLEKMMNIKLKSEGEMAK